MKIVSLKVQNVMRVSSAEIRPDGAVVIIGGNNGQGKTSLLSAIEMALGGKSRSPKRPLRDGEKSGVVELDLGDIIIERSFTEAGSKLVVKQANGATFPSPQAMLDHLVGKFAFDPLAFARAKEADQAETLRKIVGLDTSELDAEAEQTFAERTAINREERAAKARLDAAEIPSDVIDKETGEIMPPVDTTALVAELDSMRRRNEERVSLGLKADKLGDQLESLHRTIGDVNDEIRKLEAAIVSRRARLEELKASAIRVVRERELALIDADKAKDEIEDDSQIKQQLADSSKINQRIAEAHQFESLRKSHSDLVACSNRLSERLREISKTKTDMVAAARFPIEGLGIEGSSVTLRGVPFSQASGAEQLRASVAIGMALNPKLRVMIVKDGSLLDQNGMALLREIAVASDAQIWIERVGKGDDMAFVIEDGVMEKRDND